jgi:flagellin-specific chaperone FliS
METPYKEKTHVRYAVHYNDRNYEYEFHSAKRHYLRNHADILNVLEYCVSQDLKNDLYKPSDKLYNFSVVRLVNDEPDPAWEENGVKYHESLKNIIGQLVIDLIKRNS